MKDPREECENCTCFWVGTGKKNCIDRGDGTEEGRCRGKREEYIVKIKGWINDWKQAGIKWNNWNCSMLHT